MENAHLVDASGITYAAALDGDVVAYAQVVEDPDHSSLEEHVAEAVEQFDAEQALLCVELTQMLAWGNANLIGAFFEVLV